jgi:hypothetical protein
MKSTLGWIAVTTLACAASPAFADNEFGIGVRASTLGGGIEGSWQPLRYLDVRLGVNYFSFEESGSLSGINYDGTLNLESVYTTVSYHFPMSPIRVTAGIYGNGNEYNLVSDDSAFIDIGGTVYSRAQAGTLRSTTSFEDVSPYAGIGFDFSVFRRLGLNVDIGLLWQGDPQVTLTADGTASNNAGFRNSLEIERREIEDEVSEFKAWPVISLGFYYNF